MPTREYELLTIHPKLPMRNIGSTKKYYIEELGFVGVGQIDFKEYLMLKLDGVELHFFLYPELNPLENYGQVYIRIRNLDSFYKSLLAKNVQIHPNGHLALKPWGQREFSLLDPDHNLLTFGEPLHSL